MWAAIKRAGSIEVGRPAGDLSSRAAGWLVAALVVLSTLGYGLSSRHVKNIWILPDELVYGSLARSIATTGHFALRGVDTLAYPVGYPLLIASAFRLADPVRAYDAAKWANALLMSLAAIPTYLIARRLLPRWHSLLAAALTLLVPSLAYTGVLMSENAFFPLVLLSLLAFVVALERPTIIRQVAALVSIVPAIAVRSEGLVLIPILLGSLVLVAASAADRGRSYAGSLGRELWRFALILILLPVSVIVLFAGEAAIGKSPGAVLGRYSGSLNAYPVLRTLRWAVYQFIDLEFYLAVLPVVPAIIVAVTLLLRRGIPRAHRAVAATTITSVALFVLAAAAASQGAQGGGFNYPSLPPELHDRYCFFVAPLCLVLFLFWVHRRHEFSNRVLIALVVAAAALPLVLPYADVHSNAEFDALALLPWHNSLIADRNVHYAMAVTAGLLGLLLIPRRRSLAFAQVALVAVLLWIMGSAARQNIADASVVIRTSHPDARSWIDRAVPGEANVAVLWAPDPGWSLAKTIHREQALWRAEFLDPSVKSFFYVGRGMHYDLPATKVRLRNGQVLFPAGPGAYRYLLVASSVPIDGTVIGRDRKAGLTLYRLALPAS